MVVINKPFIDFDVSLGGSLLNYESYSCLTVEVMATGVSTQPSTHFINVSTCFTAV